MGLFSFGGKASGEVEKTKKQTDVFGKKDALRTKQLEIDEAGIMAIIGDILQSNKGLANIFSEEQVAGLYGGSVAKQDTASLLGQIAGELARVTGKTVDITDEVSSEQTFEREDRRKGAVEVSGGFGL